MRSGFQSGSMLWKFFMLLLLAPAVVLAQGGRASITGIVADSTGAVVPDVTVIVTNTGTGVAITTKTNEAGAYVVPLLVIGTYNISATKTGFKTAAQSGITLSADQALSLNLSLVVGETTVVMEVKADAAMIEAQTAALGTVVSERAITELPLNGRNPANLVLLTPGTTDALAAPGSIGKQSYTTFPTEQGASTNGTREGSTLYLLDGTLNMDSYEGLAAPFPNPDATQEFRVINNNFEAQYGFAAGGVVSIATKSGTNAWHGNAFEYLRNGDFNAANTFTQVGDQLRQNQFGASIGGPIRKDKLFVFGNTQMTRQFLKAGGTQAWVLSKAMLNGDFSKVGVPIIKDPITGNPEPGNQIPVSLFDPAALKMARNLPVSDDPTGRIVVPGAGRTTMYKEFTARADYYASPNHRIFGRTYWNDFDQPILPASFINSDRSWLARWQSHTVNDTWTISPTIINSLTGSYSRNSSNSTSGLRGADGKPICYSQYIDLAEPPTSPCSLDAFAVSGGVWLGQNFNSVMSWSTSFNDALSISKGRHLIVAGVDVNRQSWHLLDDWLSLPVVSFSNAATGFGYGDFLVGRVDSMQQGAGENTVITGTQVAAYVQDQIKLRPNLTLSAGLRWEPFFAPGVAGGHIGVFMPGVQSQRYPNAPTGLVYPGDTGVAANGVPSTRGIFDPRLGLAWQPMPRTSVRGAFGMFNSPIAFTYWAHTEDNAPFSPSYTVSAEDPLISASYSGISPYKVPFDHPWANYAPTGGKSPFPPFMNPANNPPASTTFLLPSTILGVFDPNFKLATSLDWNLSIERNFATDWLARAAYVGSETYHLPDVMERNPGIYAAGGVRTRYQNFSSITVQESGATSSYESLQLSVEKRFSHGFQVQSSYTHSKTLDTVTGGSQQFVAVGLMDPFNLKNNKGWSGLDIPNVFKMNFVWQMPALNGSNALLKNVVGGWQLSGILTWQNGAPFGIGGGCCDRAMTHISGTRADYVPGQQVWSGGGRMEYFNIKAFQPSALGTFGNTPRMLFFGPSIFGFDAGVSKHWSYKERYKLQFRWEMFNALNHPVYGNPNADVSSAQFGQIWGLANSPRVMQGALKLNF